MANKKTMDRSSFQKLFRELYTVNPVLWNSILEKSGKTVYSKKGTTTRGNTRKVDRQSMSTRAFDSLMNIDYDKFNDFSRKSDAQIHRPKSIRVNDETLGKLRRENQRNKNAFDVSYADSAAVDSFNIKDNGDGTKDVTVKFTSGDKDYLYPDVPANVANGMYAAPSKGAYMQNVMSRYSDYSNPKVQAKIRQGE